MERTWEAQTSVRFTGWGACTSTSKGIRILVNEEGPEVMKLGSQLDGRPNGIRLNFTFTTWGTSCRSNVQDCVDSLAVHEFGHALGLTHEQNRSDTPTLICTKHPQGPTGDTMIGALDRYSVMNYCNPTWNGDGNLSTGDINGIQFLYGHLGSGIMNYGGSFREGGSNRHGDLITLGGLVRQISGNPADWTPGSMIMRLPETKRPAKRHIFTINQHHRMARVDVDANGGVRYYAGNPAHHWANIANIIYAKTPDGNLTLGAGVSHYASAYENGSYSRRGNAIVLGGLVRKSGWNAGDVIGTLPVGYRPSKIVILNANRHEHTARIDVHPDGRIIFVHGNLGYTWLSLSGLAFSAADTSTALPVGSNMHNYGYGFQDASYSSYGDTVVVRGLVQKNSGLMAVGDVIATLPADKRPAKTLIFNLNQHRQSARVDVLANDHIVFQRGSSPHNYVSLSGISFRAE